MSERRRLPQRRPSTNFDIESQGLRFTVTGTIINGEYAKFSSPIIAQAPAPASWRAMRPS